MLINQREINGNAYCLWEGYYVNGNLSYKGSYNNGKPHGYWEVFHQNGIIEEIKYYAD